MHTKAALLTILLATSAFAQSSKEPKNADIQNIGIRDINKGEVNFTSFEQEISMGRELSVEVERRMTLVNDPVVNGYVDQLAQRIAANSDVKVPVTIRVVKSKDVNAMALPGGFIYVNTGLIRAADNEAELGFAIARSVAHVAARHATENGSRGQLLNLATIPMVFLGGPDGLAFRQVYAGQLIVPVAFLSFTRQAAAEADFLGTQYLYKAGYDPESAVTLLEKIQRLEVANPQTGISKLLATHPPTADRIQATRETIARVLPTRNQSIVTTAEFTAVKARVQ